METNNFIIDPLQYFPIEICEEIFKNLSVKQLMKASSVSTAWYHFVASSPNLMKNVKVKVSCNMDQNFSRKIVDALTKSSRRYENLEIESCTQCLSSIFGLLDSKKWKRVTISQTSLTNSEQATEFFKYIEADVEELNLSAVYVRFPYSDGKNKGLIFPRLKIFSAKNIQAFLFHDIFENITRLEDFTLFSNDQNVASLRAIMKFLKMNDRLKSLQISGSVFYQIMYEDISKIVPFKLQKLVLANGSYHSGEFYKKIYQHLASLLRQQAESLRIVSMDDWMGENVLQSVFELPNLKELTIKGFTHIYDNINWKVLYLAKNSSIKKMDISIVPDDLELLKAIILASPKLNHLTISLMNVHFIDFINQHAKELKVLNIGTLNLTSISDQNIFKNLKQLSVRFYRPCFIESIMEKAEEERSHFENMFYNHFVYILKVCK